MVDARDRRLLIDKGRVRNDVQFSGKPLLYAGQQVQVVTSLSIPLLSLLLWMLVGPFLFLERASESDKTDSRGKISAYVIDKFDIQIPRRTQLPRMISRHISYLAILSYRAEERDPATLENSPKCAILLQLASLSISVSLCV